VCICLPPLVSHAQALGSERQTVSGMLIGYLHRPILTYGGTACLKRGTKALKHGIIYQRGKSPHTVKGEPKLGFRPVAVDMTEVGEKLARESRVIYGKLVTIEHNVKVLFIGRIVSKDYEVVRTAVEQCWQSKNKRAAK
jgi:hypothetical protein